VTDLVALAGGRNPLADRDVKSCPLTDAEVQGFAPEAVVISWCGVPTFKYRPDVVLRREAWRGVPAVRAGRVVGVSEAYLGRPGPRLVEGFRALREVVRACHADMDG
jgi:iron complex transport system substrate-binding protein